VIESSDASYMRNKFKNEREKERNRQTYERHKITELDRHTMKQNNQTVGTMWYEKNCNKKLNRPTLGTTTQRHGRMSQDETMTEKATIYVYIYIYKIGLHLCRQPSMPSRSSRVAIINNFITRHVRNIMNESLSMAYMNESKHATCA